jgi:hypothetical protein
MKLYIVLNVLRARLLSMGGRQRASRQRLIFRASYWSGWLWIGFAFCNNFVALAQSDGGQNVVYESETRFATDPQHGITAYAGAMTIIHFSVEDSPALIGFAQVNKQGKEVVQGEYGVDPNGKPKDEGRLIYEGEAMPYVVTGTDGTYTYHLSYLELTTVKDAARGYLAYATKAIASDNKMETLGGGTSTYKLPPGGQLAIDHGKIKIGANYISPNYDCSGTIP